MENWAERERVWHTLADTSQNESYDTNPKTFYNSRGSLRGLKTANRKRAGRGGAEVGRGQRNLRRQGHEMQGYRQRDMGRQTGRSIMKTQSSGAHCHTSKQPEDWCQLFWSVVVRVCLVFSLRVLPHAGPYRCSLPKLALWAFHSSMVCSGVEQAGHHGFWWPTFWSTSHSPCLFVGSTRGGRIWW